MSESQDEVRNGFSLGVLIIGSLHWDLDCRREKWRLQTASICTVSDSSGRRSGTDEGPGNEDVPTRWSFPRVSVRISTAERSSYRASTVYTAKTISSEKPSVFGQLKLKRNRVIQDVYQPTGGALRYW